MTHLKAIPITGNEAIDEAIAHEGDNRFLDGLVSARTLQETKFPPIKWAVPGFITEGTTLLAGRPKSGKSWMALDMALAIGFGGTAFGSVEVEQGDVLYLALEDNERRLQSRINQLLRDKSVPDRTVFQTSWPRLNDGGLQFIGSWIDMARQLRLVILDTLQHIREPLQGKRHQYEAEYQAVTPLTQMAGDRNVAIVIVHHVKKGEATDPLEMVSGSFGLTGGTDASLVISRDSQGTTLYGRGRDLHEFERAMSFDTTTGLWGILGDADEVRRSDERNRIIEVLREQGSAMGPKDIATATGMTEKNVRQMVGRMVLKGEIERIGRGQYQAM